jgi:CubicO group peptidase (beta-lactamase class C family)
MDTKNMTPRFDRERLARIGATIRRDIEDGKYHGAALRVASNDGVVLDLIEGYANREAGQRLSPDSVFCTLSVAKQFTNVLALSLVERGLLRLHAPIAELLPQFGASGLEKVNLWHLLTHTSGICSAFPRVPPEIVCSIEQLTNYAASQKLESLPGAQVNYSICVVHSVIAALCLRADGRGRTYSQMLDEEIFAPLQMRDTSLSLRTDLEARYCPVKATWSGGGAVPPETVEAMNRLMRIPGAEIPGGGAVSTMNDLFRFVEMLRNGGELQGVRILSPGMIDYASRNQTGDLRMVLMDALLSSRNWLPTPAYIGLGFFVRGEGITPGPFGVLNSSHSIAGMGAGATAFWIDPQRNLSFTFLSTGLMEASRNLERLGILSDLVLASIV